MLGQQCLYVFVLEYENCWFLYGSHIQKCLCEIILWGGLVSHPSTVRVAEISCGAASRPGGADDAPHAPESAWQAVNHVRSFICQSPPKCRAVRMDNSPQHGHTATSSCLAEWLSVPQSQRSQFGPSDSWMMSLQRLQQAVQSNTWLTLSNTPSFIRWTYSAASAL